MERIIKEIAHFYPTLHPEKQEDGTTKWVPACAEVGKVLEDGSIEGTPYKFEGRGISGGGAYTDFGELIPVEDGFIHPARNWSFHPTKKGTGYWNRDNEVFVKEPYYIEER